MFDDREDPPQDPDIRAALCSKGVEAMRHEGVPLGYDPALQTWVRLDRVEDRSRPMLSGSVPPDLPGLREWQAGDAATYARLLDDPEVWRFLYEPCPAPMTEALARDLIAIAAAPHHLVRAVIAGGEAVGQVRLLPDAAPDTAGSSAELSYWLGRAHWGKGHGARMVRAACRAGFDTWPGLTRIVAYVHPENHASRRILQGCGFSTAPPRADGWLSFEALRD